MIVGVPRETAAGERRVALTPADAAMLSAHGLRVVVEQTAGHRADFADAAYRRAGARVLPDAAAVFAASAAVVWVKPPVYELDSMPLRDSARLFGFQDPVQRADRIERLRARGVETIAFEQISPGTSDPLSAMSRIAGEVAYAEGRALLAARGRIRSLVLGCGQAGLAAVTAAVAAGDDPPLVVGRRAERERAATGCGAAGYLANPEPRALAEVIAGLRPHLVICAAGRGGRAPVLLDRAGLGALAAGSVVVDLTAKAGGNTVATVANATVVVGDGVIVTHRSNYPSARPHAASRAYGAAAAGVLLRTLSMSVA
ncbi:hypothetical protein JK358_27800 [Nocardia sp. 2]|uniref:proton-translocating NAD(P)(+) transhydrogenase n=1 Tax=Nocardia acididurans TaxID=2802282 RepID=A0ABS1MG79_9NOCA|nr:hypothetical protein [Nocardia acididurans]MBL1078218.1 hypothetical protein [Nocardia acididurans]